MYEYVYFYFIFITDFNRYTYIDERCYLLYLQLVAKRRKVQVSEGIQLYTEGIIYSVSVGVFTYEYHLPTREGKK